MLQLVLLEINIDVAGVADSHEVKVKLSEFDEKDMKSLESARYNWRLFKEFDFSFYTNLFDFCIWWRIGKKAQENNLDKVSWACIIVN